MMLPTGFEPQMYNTAPINTPLGSWYDSGLLIGNTGSAANAGAVTNAIFGYIKKVTIDVQRPYTGSAGTMTAEVFHNAVRSFDATNVVDTGAMSAVVNLKVAGKRVVDTTTVTGAQSGDTLSAFGRSQA
jgi:hypothetical protein